MTSKARAQFPERSSEQWEAAIDRWSPRIVVDETTGCWIWTGCTNRDGYPKVKIDGTTLYLHRVMYALQHGGIDPELELDHTGSDGLGCSSRACINPSHLEEVTHAENVARITLRKVA